MPDIKILRNGQQIVSKRFYGHFIVSGSNKVIFWRTDEDKHWSTDEVDSSIIIRANSLMDVAIPVPILKNPSSTLLSIATRFAFATSST